MNVLKLKTKTIEYELIRKRKRTLSITIRRDASIVVSIPLKTSISEVEKVLLQKLPWIEKKIEEVKEIKPTERNYIEGEDFLYNGEVYKLKIQSDTCGKNIGVEIDENQKSIIVFGKKDAEKKDIRRALEKWYVNQSNKKIEERVKYIINKTSLTPKLVKVKTLKASWGICTNKGNISLSWRLIMAPTSVMDYVIIHELCHLKHHNHSKEFWNLVEHYMPDYKKQKSG